VLLEFNPALRDCFRGAGGRIPDTAPEIFSLSHDAGVGEGRGEGNPLRPSDASSLVETLLLSPALHSMEEREF
jgi:hypothetical protein